MSAPAPSRCRAAALLLAVGAVLAGSCERGPPRSRPHVVLITADALRADHLSAYGYPRPTSPRLDAFAREALRFSQAMTVIPKTGPSFATLFSGRHPNTHGIAANRYALPEDLPLEVASYWHFVYGDACAGAPSPPTLMDRQAAYGSGFPQPSTALIAAFTARYGPPAFSDHRLLVYRLPTPAAAKRP